MEQHLEAVLAFVAGRELRSVLPGAERMQPQCGPDPDVRQHLHPRARLGRRRKRGQENQALGRSRGGFGTKIHIKCDLEGHPLDFHLTANQASDTKQFEILLDSDPDVIPRGVVADKGYDAAGNRAAARRRGAVPIIPYRKNTKGRARFFPRRLYRLRARVEQFIGKLKRFKRIAMRCEKTASNFAAFVALACGFVLIKSVHKA
jgi:transposase